MSTYSVGDKVIVYNPKATSGTTGGTPAVVAWVGGGAYAVNRLSDGVPLGRWSPRCMRPYVETDRPPVEGSALDKAYQRYARARQYGKGLDLGPAADDLIDLLLRLAVLPQIDTASPASCQFYIETGRFMYEGEEF